MTITDDFARSHLPAAAAMPDLIFTLPELQYPPRLNCVTRLLDHWVRAGEGGRPCLIGAGVEWSYAETQAKVNRIANVRIFPFGLSDRPDRLELHVPVKKSGSFGFGLSHLGGSVQNEDGGRERVDEVVELVTLDGFITCFPITRLDLIKADIEGWELRMLMGGADTLAKFRPVLWIEVVDHHLARAGDSMNAVWTFLTALDYRAYVGNADGSFTPLTAPREGDILWIPAEKTG